MKILYVDIFAETINPTASLTPLLFRNVAPDTVFYGPGLTSRQGEIDAPSLLWHAPFM